MNVTAYLSLKDVNSTAPVLASRALDKQAVVLPYIESIYLYNAYLDILYSSKTGYQCSLEECSDEEMYCRLTAPDFFMEYHGQPLPSHQTRTAVPMIFSATISRIDMQMGKEGKIPLSSMCIPPRLQIPYSP